MSACLCAPALCPLLLGCASRTCRPSWPTAAGCALLRLARCWRPNRPSPSPPTHLTVSPSLHPLHPPIPFSPAFALICDYVSNPDPGVRCGAVLGLGLAYAGTRREEVAELLVPLVVDTDVPMEVGGRVGGRLGVGAGLCPGASISAAQVRAAQQERWGAELLPPARPLLPPRTHVPPGVGFCGARAWLCVLQQLQGGRGGGHPDGPHEQVTAARGEGEAPAVLALGLAVVRVSRWPEAADRRMW